MYTYLLVLLFSILVPVMRSFERKHIHFIGYFPFLLPAMCLTAAIFIPWDVLYTRWGVWGFNPDYHLDFTILGLPLEEWSFFFVIPYVCLFSYEVLNYFIKRDLLGRVAGGITWVLLAVFTWILIQNTDKTYTTWSMIFNIVLLALIGVAWRPVWMGRFYLMFGVILVPFLLVNGVLTGSFFERIVVWYNPDDILNFRLLTIPIEDLFYAFGMLLMNTALYEFFRRKAGKSAWSEA